ncbi:adenylyl-sulfate kinase [Glutamicibacter arilaitensis]|uniref:adenylyl-sulfate kinase n=1 Tax=Glutamicibacter arilaitensis TaxID=256701 RepID=UPI003FD24A2E
MDLNSGELIELPLWQLDESLLDVVELALGGLISRSVLAQRLVAELPEFSAEGTSAKHGAVLADPDGTGLAVLRWLPWLEDQSDVPVLTELSALATPEHGLFREYRVTKPLEATAVVLFNQAPTLAQLEHLHAQELVVPGTVFLLLATGKSAGVNSTASQIQQVAHAAALFTGARHGYVLVPPGIDPEEIVERLSTRVQADLRTTESAAKPTGGTVVMFSGLSGSGKSTLARAVRQQIQLERNQRAILLDGDDIRRFISKGLGFTREDRETNIERIGWIAARISEAGGIALCAPIAPFARTRATVRELASQTGDFLLIHVSTPLEVCEARDRKGLYAKARAGLVKDFTGIDSPYEVPLDAELALDLSTMSIPEATLQVMELLNRVDET